MTIARWDEVEPKRRDLGFLGAAWRDLGRAAGSKRIGVQRIELAAGGIPTPAHVHAQEEEIFFVLAGSGLSWQDGKTYEVRPGDCLVHTVVTEAHTLRAGPDGLDVLAFGEREQGWGAHLPRAGVSWLDPSWVEAGSGEPPWEREVAAGEPDFPEPSERVDWIVDTDSVERQRGGEGESSYTLRDLGCAAGSERTGLKLYELDAGKMGPPPHCHSAEEELFVVLEGEGTLQLIRASGAHGTIERLGAQETHAVRRGHVVSRPPATRVAHAFVAGAAGLSYLAYGTREPNDIAFYPRSNKVYLRGIGVLGRIEPLGYWDGETAAS